MKKNVQYVKIVLLFCFINFCYITQGQPAKTYTAAEILQQLKKINVFGSVLYIAAHPDDENTRLLAYLANEKLYRTGYLSLTRGDGGQNLIGNEQGVELGLIRTQELLAARRIDGAEQFFTRAYDFGFCKSTREALDTWGEAKILSDVVWVIRKFKPDVIITRFPTDNRAGHGHHSASAVLAREAFAAAADPSKFPEQLQQGVTLWQAKRLLWNTFNFGTTNTQSEDQFKVDVGMYNPLLGKSYGEIAALGRSQHKSQGFGVPAQRGSIIEYFETIHGDKPSNDLMDGVELSWKRMAGENKEVENNFQALTDAIINNYSPLHPENSITQLVDLYQKTAASNNSFWKTQKLEEIKNSIEACSGLFVEATTGNPFAVQGDSLKIVLTAVNRAGIDITDASAMVFQHKYSFSRLLKNINTTQSITAFIQPTEKLTQPFWLQNTMSKGSFNITNQQLIGKAENDPVGVVFNINIGGQNFSFKKPLKYKYTDPVKGEIYQPVAILPKVEVNFTNDVFLSINNQPVIVTSNAVSNINDSSSLPLRTTVNADFATVTHNSKKGTQSYDPGGFTVVPNKKNYTQLLQLAASNTTDSFASYKKIIQYDHIPSIVYFHSATAKLSAIDLKTEGSLIGYIPGAGDKIPEALEQMGYKVIVLKQNDLIANNLKQFDAIVTGVRAYNMHAWLSSSYDALMQYVNDGGVLLTQYNTNNSIGPVKAKIAPYPFTISRSRVTDEEAKVNFLLPGHPVLNYPNKISEKDFEGWVQERSIYDAENIDSNYQCVLSMKDPGEQEQKGSLIIADYGKGRFIYTGLVFFRQLPAGTPGAYRLFANLIANKRNSYVK